MNLKQLYFVHTELNGVVVKASNRNEAKELAEDWFYHNVSSTYSPNVNWITELCDNDIVVE